MALLAFNSCKRQDICKLESQINSALIEFTVDWSNSYITPSEINNISIYAYNHDYDTPYIKVSGDIDSTYINLPEGKYTILIFNDFVGDIKGMNFKDAELFEEFCAEVIERSSTAGIYYQPQSDELVAQELGELASWRYEELEVSIDMVSCGCCDDINSLELKTILEVTPTPITTQCTLLLDVDNLDNAAYIEASIRGLATGAYLATGDRLPMDDISTIYNLQLESRSYSSDTDGTAWGTISTFGKPDDTSQIYEVVIDVILNTGERVTYLRDITSQIEEQDNIELFISLTSDQDKITLPESSTPGFGVSDWGDNEHVELL